MEKEVIFNRGQIRVPKDIKEKISEIIDLKPPEKYEGRVPVGKVFKVEFPKSNLCKIDLSQLHPQRQTWYPFSVGSSRRPNDSLLISYRKDGTMVLTPKSIPEVKTLIGLRGGSLRDYRVRLVLRLEDSHLYIKRPT